MNDSTHAKLVFWIVANLWELLKKLVSNGWQKKLLIGILGRNVEKEEAFPSLQWF